MEILRTREEKGYGINLYLVDDNGRIKVKASKISPSGEKVLSAPLDVHIAITNKCNLKCPYCYANNKDFMEQNDMTVEEIINVIDKFADANVFKISWSGGEPFCRSELFEILKYTRKKGFKQSIITNGMLIDRERAQRLEELNIAVQISLHEITDKMFWDKCSLLINNNVDTVLDIVMDTNICGNIGKIIDYCHNVGIKNVKFGPVIPMGAAKNLIDLNNYMCTIDNIINEIDEYRENNNVRIITQFDNHKYNQEFQVLGLRELLCEGATTLMYIDNNGDVYPCPLLKENQHFYAGNILEDKIDDIWHGNIMAKYRKIDIAETGCDGCGQICGVWCRGLTLAYTGDIMSHSPFCSYTKERI